MIIIGIDPGLNGAIALLRHGQLVYADDLPVVDKRISAQLLTDWFHDIQPDRPDLAIIEKVHAMPKQGVVSTFNFGRALGTIEGVLGALRIPTIHTPPTTWKRLAGITADKNTARQKAIDLWPEQAHLFARIKDADRAEAALLAHIHPHLIR